MEAQPTALPHLTYLDSTNSSPRSRNNDSGDEPNPSPKTATTNKLRLMCCYGGHIVPRSHDKSLCYVGGDTRILVVDRTKMTLPTASVNSLLGLDDDAAAIAPGRAKISKQDQEVQSVPDSPMRGTNSSFGFSSSSPSAANLRPTKVRVEDGGVVNRVQDQKGIEEQFTQLGI